MEKKPTMQSQAFNPEMLILARESRGKTQADLATLLNTTQSRVSRLEDGLGDLPEELQIPLVSALGYPIQFYFQRAKVEAPLPTFFRRHLTLPKTVLKQCIARMNIMKMQIARLLEASEPLECRIPHLDPDEVNGGAPEVARRIRQLWRIPDGPIRNLTQVVEEAGCIVIHFDFGTRKIDGCSDVVGTTPVVFLNLHLLAARLRFTLAHELGHLIMHSFPSEEAEMQAHLFAAELLMPAEDIKALLLPVNLERLARLKLQWRVAITALLKRAEDLRLISKRAARQWWVIMSKAGYRESEPYDNDIPKETPSLLRELVDMHLQDLGFTAAQLASSLSLQEEEFLSFYNFHPVLRVVA